FSGFSKDIQVCLEEGKTLDECQKGKTGYSIPWIGEYLIAVYKWAVRAIAILAVIIIMWGGLQWILARGNSSAITEAKSKISSALIGIVIIVGMNVFLSAINPNLTILKPITLGKIEPIIITPLDSDKEEGGISGPNAGTSIDMGGNCFPVSADSIKQTQWNFGNSRSSGKRCHAGIDILTNWRSGNDSVVAIGDGRVLAVYGFYTCSTETGKGGHVSAIFIDHKKLNYTVLYGEVDDDSILVKNGDEVRAGQLLGQASRCGMLHLEMYEAGARGNKTWYPPNGQRVENQPNYCQQNFLNTKPSTLLDPTATLKYLDGKRCSI
ncbi:MAG: M23 family metallopeptidase, partial [Patescibacteria group bacterium]|nr:M23 family metallopeptidase [Patescibacteria group bacterium]